MLKDIEKAILNSEVGLNPDNNGEMIRLTIPPLTEERRKLLVKQAKQEVEEAKVGIRNSRRDAIDAIKKLVKEGLSEDLAKDAETDMQKVHDRYVKKAEELYLNKEKEILTI